MNYKKGLIEYEGVIRDCQFTETDRFDDGTLMSVIVKLPKGAIRTVWNWDKFKWEPQGINECGLVHIDFKTKLIEE